MARGKISDRIANRLGNHAVGHHIRGKKMGEVLVSALFALIILALVGVWAAATAGYESRSVFSPNWNLTDNDHWYSKFIPSPPGPLCQPAFINTGSTFRTNNGIFLWEMGKGFNVSAAKINGNEHPSVNFNATILSQYSDDILDHCDVSGASIDMDLFQATVTVQIYATCIDPKWPALLHSQNVYSIDQSQLLDQSLWFNDIVTPDPENNASIYDAMNGLAADLWKRQKAVYLRSSEVLPTIRGLRMVNDNNCALVTGAQNKSECYDAPLKLSNNSAGFFLYPNLTVATTDYDELNWNITTDNFIQSIFAAARYDFASNMTTNIFVNSTARQQVIVGSDANQINNNTALMNPLDGAAAFLNTPEFPPPKIARVRTSYMCNVMKIKQTPSFVIAVMGMAFAIFGVVFAAAVAIVKKLTGKDLGAAAPKPIQALSPITSITSFHRDEREREDDEGGKGGADTEKGHTNNLSAGSSNDPRFDSRLPTPAPSYHLNARASEAAYSPLTGGSEPGGPGSITPNAMRNSNMSSFSSLGGFARSFTDKLPFGNVVADKMGGLSPTKIPGLPNRSDLSMPSNAMGSNRFSGGANKWMNMAGAGVAGAATAAATGAAVNHFSDKHKAASDAFGNVQQAGNNAQAMFARPAQATQFDQIYQANPTDYVPFAYPETIREGGTNESTPTPGQSSQSAQPEVDNAHAQVVQPETHNPYVPAALAAGAGGLVGAGAAHALSGQSDQGTSQQTQQQPTDQQQIHAPVAQRPTISPVQFRATSPGPPTGIRSPLVPTRMTSPGPPVGQRASVPSRVTSPGPPSGHTSSVPARVTSPGPPVGARSVGAPAHITAQGPPVGHRSAAPAQGHGAPIAAAATGTAVGAGAAAAAGAAHATSPSAAPSPPSGSATSSGPPVGSRSVGAPARVTSPGPPVGHRSAGAPARVTSPGPPVGHRSAGAPARVTSPGPPVGYRSTGAPARVTSPGPPVGSRSSVPARVTSPGPPVGVRADHSPATATTSAAPGILAPQPRRAPSPTWLAEQEAAAAARAQGAQPLTTDPDSSHSLNTSASQTQSQTPDSASGMHSPLSQIQRTLHSSYGDAQNTAQQFSSNNPFKQ